MIGFLFSLPSGHSFTIHARSVELAQLCADLAHAPQKPVLMGIADALA